MTRPFRVRFLACLAASLVFSPSSAWAQKSPQEELAALRAAEGINVSLFASEPMITNPSAIDVDTRGRVWAAEIQWYRSRAKDPPADKIKVLEDTDGDGRADKVTVFAEGLFCPMSICVAGERVFVATSPDLWVFEDKNGDLVADGPPRKLLAGFGGYNHDHGAHSLVLGPDHRWWMSHGDGGFDVTGVDGSRIKYRWGAMLRGELDGSRLETVAVNFRNPYELCVSSFGEAFCSDNDNDGNESARICWILEGGNYGWFGGPPFEKRELAARVPAGTPYREAWHFRGYTPGFVPGTLVTGFGSPTGICFYEGAAFGPKYKNAPLHTDPGPREVRLYRHAPEGAGMKATSEVFLATQGDDYFRPDDICAAPDGSLYVSDWYDGGVGGHGYNNPDQGRIFLLRPAGKKLSRREKPGPYATIADALEGLKSPNLATQFLARQRLLAEGNKSHQPLVSLLADPEPNFQARALWVLDRIGGQARGEVERRLTSSDDAQRALAVRILRRHGAEYEAPILALAGDRSAEVRREVLLAIRQFPGEKAEGVLAEMALAYDGRDRYLLETLNVAAGDRREKVYARLAAQGKTTLDRIDLWRLLNPQAAAELATRALAGGDLRPETARALLETAGGVADVAAGRGLLRFVAEKKSPVELRRAALEILATNLGGSWASLAQEEETARALAGLLADAQMQGATLAAFERLDRVGTLADKVRELARDSQAALDVRLRAIGVLVESSQEGTPALLRELLADRTEGVRQAALAGLVDLQDARTLREVLSTDQYAPETRSAAADRLIASTGGAILLLRLLDEPGLADSLRQQIVAKAVAHPDSNVRTLYERFVPESERPKKLGGAIRPEEILALQGDPRRGETIFQQSSAAQCKNCHTVRGAGANIGPDLTMIGKKYERRALLETILAPSQAIAPEYVPHLLETSEGRVFAGFLVEQTAEQVVLKETAGKLIRVQADQVEAILPQKISLMPELVLRDVTAQDAADLLAFLVTLRQGNQDAVALRLLGPFDARDKNLDAPFEPEKQLAEPDLAARFAGLENKPLRWEVVPSDGMLGFAGIDTVKYDRSRSMRADQVVHYALSYVESPSEQEATLLIGSDDGCKAWLNGEQVHAHDVTRALGYAQDQVAVRLRSGRNVVVIKVRNGNPPGGVSLAIRSAEGVQLRTE